MKLYMQETEAPVADETPETPEEEKEEEEGEPL